MLHIRHVFENALAGSITYDDAIHLFTECKPSTLFTLADNLRKMTRGDVVTYVVNRNINFTNICIGSCKFCAFRREDGYRLSIGEIIAKARAAVDVGASEICIQGGLLNDMYIEDYCEILRSVKSEFPHLHLHAYSPMEVFHAAHTSNISVRTALSKLKQSGLDSMPGTAAEVFSKRVRSIICPEKLSAEDWLTVVRSAHEMGIPTTATMMYGHIETIKERIEHMLCIRELQKKTGGFTEFVPLLFMPHNNALGKITNNHRDELDDLKVHAIARIIFHTHINNIQTSWVKLGIKRAQDTLHCGANDLGGTLMEERISKSAGAANGEYITPKEFNTLIKSVNRRPAIRNTLYTSISLQ